MTSETFNALVVKAGEDKIFLRQIQKENRR